MGKLDVNIDHKICTKCNIEKELEQFYRCFKGKFGRHSICRECNKIERIKNKEYNKNYKHNHYLKNKAKINQKNKTWRKTKNGKESRLKEGRKYANNHREQVRNICRNRRQKRKNIMEKFTVQQALMVREKFKEQCFNCGSKERLCIDHHYSLDKGYALAPYNAVMLCISCNTSKLNRWPEEFYTSDKLQELHAMDIMNITEPNTDFMCF
jgi:hypothetical protein